MRKNASAFSHRNPCARRRGFSLLELLAASTLLTVALVPALRLMRDSMRISRHLEVRECLVTVAMGQLELEAQQMARSWHSHTSILTAPGIESGHPNVLVEVESSDSPSAGGIAGSLASVRVSAFEDRNGNGQLDSGESTVTFATKIANLTSYSYEGRGA